MTCDKLTIFFSNPKVSGESLIEPHYKRVAERAKQVTSQYILSIQDNTFLNFTTHKAKTKLGRIGGRDKHTQYGIIQHSTLLVTAENEPLGIIDLAHFDYDDFDQHIDRHQRSIEKKHSICWINASSNRRKRLGNLDQKVVTVCDREGDFFEFLHDLRRHNESYVIRAQHDRFTGEKHLDKSHPKEDKLFKRLEAAECLGEIQTTITEVDTHQMKEISLSIRRLTGVKVPPSRMHLRANSSYEPVILNVVMAQNGAYRWILLTDLPVESLSACEEVMTIYKHRWHIEDYHKVLKTGYQIDEIYLHASYEAIINAATMISVSACRLYWLIYVGRVEKTITADKLLTEYEWKCVYVYFKEKVPDEPPPLAEIMIKIACMGGYKRRKKGQPPGIKLMWLGLQALTIAAQVYGNLLSIKT